MTGGEIGTAVGRRGREASAGDRSGGRRGEPAGGERCGAEANGREQRCCRHATLQC
jgi:hypothetical protein